MQPCIQQLGMGWFTMRARLLLLLLLGAAEVALLAVMTSTDVNIMTFNDDMYQKIQPVKHVLTHSRGPNALAWETAAESGFRMYAQNWSTRHDLTACHAEPLSCQGRVDITCALATPCVAKEMPVDGAYERSVAYWRHVYGTAHWSERSVPNPYTVHPSLSERKID